MSLFRFLLQAVRTWRHRRGGPKTSQRAVVTLEHLDHRQLLSTGITFSGNTTLDFPDSLLNHGVVQSNFNPVTDQASTINDATLNGLIGVTPDGLSENGFNFTAFRVSYDPTADTLNIGLIPADNLPIISGDLDNNGNSGNLSPAVQTYVNANFPPVDGNGNSVSFVDYPDLQLGEEIYAFLDLNGNSTAQVVAGFPLTTDFGPNGAAKVYEVATADNPSLVPPTFGTDLGPAFTGNVYLNNNPNHPDLEFQIKNFRELYQQETGQTLTPASTISIGLFANTTAPTFRSTILNYKPVNIGQATLPTPQPLTPPISINPHQDFHINTAHPTDVKVYVFGTTDLPVDQIDPGLGHARRRHPDLHRAVAAHQQRLPARQGLCLPRLRHPAPRRPDRRDHHRQLVQRADVPEHGPRLQPQHQLLHAA